MREDDDHIRLYAPLLRRIIILVAIVIAVPVVMWTITAFMRTYVAPPKLPTFRPIATATNIITPEDPVKTDATPGSLPAAAAASAQAKSIPPIATAARSTATATDASAVIQASTGPYYGDRLSATSAMAPRGAPPVAEVTPAPPPFTPQPPILDRDATPSALPASATPSAQMAPQAAPLATAVPNEATPTLAMATVGNPPAASDASDDALPPADPIVGPVPMPHPRPHALALADAGVPMPRPRPATANDAAPAPSEDTPFWKKLFGN